MKNNLSFVLQLEKNGHYIAMAITVPKNQNLYHYFDGYNIHGQIVKVVHYCDTWSHALEIEKSWNDGFKANGTAWTNDDYSNQLIKK